MENKDNLLSCIDDSLKLKKYLIQKANNHNCYKIYSSLDKIKSIIDHQSIFLSNGRHWNDVRDRENFNSMHSKVQNFGCCMSFSRSENMAMWMLYGGIDKKGAMININPSVITTTIHNVQSIDLGYFDGEFQSLQTIKREDFEIMLIDILYYSQSEIGYFLKRSDEQCETNNLNALDSLNYSKKLLPWSYENECRVIVSISKDKILNSKIDTVKLSLNKQKNISVDQIVLAPNFGGERKYAQSTLGADLDWDLCKNCKSICEDCKVNNKNVE